MKDKLLKKITGVFGYKLYEKKYIKNHKISSQESIININNILNKLFEENKIKSLIQIGANDGERFDDLNFFIKKYSVKSILVEPIKEHFKKLKDNYDNCNYINFENSAISVDNEIKYLYSVKKEYLNRYSSHIPAISSFDKKHLVNHGVKSNHIEKIQINSISIKELINKYNLENLDLLYVDAEGYDGKIVFDFLKERSCPIIIFEYIHIENELFKKLINLLNEKKFKYFSVNENLICLNKDLKLIL